MTLEPYPFYNNKPQTGGCLSSFSFDIKSFYGIIIDT